MGRTVPPATSTHTPISGGHFSCSGGGISTSITLCQADGRWRDRHNASRHLLKEVYVTTNLSVTYIDIVTDLTKHCILIKSQRTMLATCK